MATIGTKRSAKISPGKSNSLLTFVYILTLPTLQSIEGAYPKNPKKYFKIINHKVNIVAHR